MLKSSRIQPEKINKITSKVKFTEPRPSVNPLRTAKKKKKAKPAGGAKQRTTPKQKRVPAARRSNAKKQPNQIRNASKQLLTACAQLSSMLLLLFMHAILLIWASAVVVSVYFKVETAGDFVSVNEALEVYGQAQGPNPYSLLGHGYSPQAHIRIESHTSQNDDKVSGFSFPSFVSSTQSIANQEQTFSTSPSSSSFVLYCCCRRMRSYPLERT